MNICFIKFALLKKNGCINFLHHFGIFAKCAILYFLRLQIMQLFKKQKKNP